MIETTGAVFASPTCTISPSLTQRMETILCRGKEHEPARQHLPPGGRTVRPLRGSHCCLRNVSTTLLRAAAQPSTPLAGIAYCSAFQYYGVIKKSISVGRKLLWQDCMRLSQQSIAAPDSRNISLRSSG